MFRIYIRVSTQEQAADDRSSLATQMRVCEGAAMINGQVVGKIYEDAGVSGAIGLAKRPAGSRLVTEAEAGDTVVASKLDRLFRSAADALNTAEDFKARGIDLILVDMGSTPVTHNGTARLFFSIMASMAEFERDRIAERMRDGRRAKRARGGHVGGPAPYGFRREGEGRHAVLVEDINERQTAAQARTLRARGMGVRRIAAELACGGYMARDGQPFQPQQIARMVAPTEQAQ